MAWCVSFNKLSLSLLKILGPYRGHHILVASFCWCQHAQAKHPLGFSLSFFIVHFFFFLFAVSHLLILSHTHPILNPPPFFFPISEMKASPQLFSLFLKRPKWGSLSDEYSTPPSLERWQTHTHIHTHWGIYRLLILLCTFKHQHNISINKRARGVWSP